MLNRGERRNIYRGKRIIGFVQRTLGGFYRGYNFAQHLGVGPFATADQAVAFVNEPEITNAQKRPTATRPRRTAD